LFQSSRGAVYLPDGQRREDAGFSCVLGNPPWDKIKPERDGFYLAYDPLIRQFQGTQKNRRIAELHRDHPAVEAAWNEYEFQTKRQGTVLLDSGIYSHQTAVIEEEVEGDDGEPAVKKKTTGGDPDCFKFFLERAWQFVGLSGTVGMVMSYGLHQSQGCAGLRRLLLDNCQLRSLVKFDNELRVFPGVHNQFKFDLVVFQKGGSTESFDAAFFHRESAKAIEVFRRHPACLVVWVDAIRNMSPQSYNIPELRGQRDVDLVHAAYARHQPFGRGVMKQIGVIYQRELDMTNDKWFFRSRSWLREHGCEQLAGERWQAATAEWYESRDYVKRPLAEWFVLFHGNKAKAFRLPWQVKSKTCIKDSELEDFQLRFELPDGYRLIAKSPDADRSPFAFVPRREASDTDLPVHIDGVTEVKPFIIGPALKPGGLFIPLVEGKSIFQFSYRRFAYVSGGGSWVVTRPADRREADLYRAPR
jgi:hypothetical protein